MQLSRWYLQKKIDKRGRKLVDYDSQRHNFQSLQCNPRKRDELKVTRGKELLEEAKRTYEQLNSELHDELPALYDSRVLFLVTNLQTLFAAEQVFHTESAKVRLITAFTNSMSRSNGSCSDEAENYASSHFCPFSFQSTQKLAPTLYSNRNCLPY